MNEPAGAEKPAPPQLNLPSREDWGLKSAPRQDSKRSGLVTLLLLVVIALQVGIFFKITETTSTTSRNGASGTPQHGTSDLPLREISARLQRNNLHGAAATAQEEHLRSIPVDKQDERRQSLVTLATQLIKTRRYEDAVVRLFEAEALHPDSETQRYIDTQVALCLRKLGKHDELSHELADRTSRARTTGPAPDGETANREVARIGVESITVADLDNMVAQEVDRQLMGLPGLAGDEREKYRERLLREFRAPQRRLQILQQIVTRMVLFREGVERELDKDENVERELDAVQESLIARQLVLQATRERIRVSDSDLQNFFQASPERYFEKPSARVRVAILEDEAKARELLSSIKTEEEFAAAAKEYSIEPSTKANGGLLEAPIVESEPLPVLGAVPELTAAIFSTAAGGTIAEPVTTPNGHAIAFVVESVPGRQPDFNEIRQQVAQDYVRQKEAEVQQELIAELFGKHAVTIRTEAFLNATEETESEGVK